jgi:serine/threonine protein kinase
MGALQTLRLAAGQPLPYDLLEEAGAGGMGTVYRAREHASGRIVALKLLRADAGDLTRFAHEAHVLAKLAHPGIVEYVAHGVTGAGQPWLAMEWLEGETLHHALKRGTLSVREALRMARSVADALATAHEAGVVHRDLKPSNVFLVRDGRLKLLDFGIAKSMDLTGLTHTGELVGTPAYMSPEQARGEAVDGRTDLFALGCIIFRCITGKLPFEGADMLAIATKLALEQAPLLSDVDPTVPAPLGRLVAALLEKNRADRPRDAARLRDWFDAIGRGEELPPSIPTPTWRDGPSRERVFSSEAPGSTLPSPSARKPVEVPVLQLSARTSGALDKTHLDVRTHEPPAEPEKPRTSPALSRAKTSPAGPRRRSLTVGLIAGCAASASVALAAVLFLQPRSGAGVGPPIATTTNRSSAAAAQPAAQGDMLGDSDRAALARGCRQLSGVLTAGQLANGGFASETRQDATAWDTAQQLFAIVDAHRACGGVGAAPIAAAAAALANLRAGSQWRDAQANPSKDITSRGETPCNAWTLLALSGAAEALNDATLAESATQARDDLLRARMPDGGFRYFRISATGEAATYSTVMANWALLDGRAADAGLDVTPGVIWLERAMPSEAMRMPGLAEQATWVLARAFHRGHGDAGTRDTLRAAARNLVVRCELTDDGACMRPINDSARIENGSGHLWTLWHPWATLASYTLAEADGLGLEPDLRRRLAAVARWGIAELGGQMDGLSIADTYKVAEYLVVISEILLARRQ